MGGCASKDKKDKVVDGDAVATDNNATENNTADGDKAASATADGDTTTTPATEANGDATANPEGCVFFVCDSSTSVRGFSTSIYLFIYFAIYIHTIICLFTYLSEYPVGTYIHILALW